MEVRWRWEREVRVLRRERRVGRFLEKRRFWSVGEQERERDGVDQSDSSCLKPKKTQRNIKIKKISLQTPHPSPPNGLIKFPKHQQQQEAAAAAAATEQH